MTRVTVWSKKLHQNEFQQTPCLSKLIGANLEVHTLGEVDGNGNGNVIIWKWRRTTKSTVGYSIFILQKKIEFFLHDGRAVVIGNTDHIIS